MYDILGGNKTWEIVIMPPITKKGNSTTTESNKKLDLPVRNLKFQQLMRSRGEINQSGMEFRFSVILRMEFLAVMGKPVCNFENTYFWGPIDNNNEDSL